MIISIVFTLLIAALVVSVCMKLADSYNTGDNTRTHARRDIDRDTATKLIRQRQQERLAAFQHREGTVAKPHGPDDVRAHEDPPRYAPPPTANPEEEK